jgi:hypothetical protein
VVICLVGGYLVYEHSFAASKTEFTSGLSGLCLADKNGATTNGNPVTVDPCNGSDGQQYTISGKAVMAKGLCKGRARVRTVVATTTRLPDLEP